MISRYKIRLRTVMSITVHEQVARGLVVRVADAHDARVIHDALTRARRADLERAPKHIVKDFVDDSKLVCTNVKRVDTSTRGVPKRIDDGSEFAQCSVTSEGNEIILSTPWIKLHPNQFWPNNDINHKRCMLGMRTLYENNDQLAMIHDAVVAELGRLREAHERVPRHTVAMERQAYTVTKNHWFRKDTTKTLYRDVQVTKITHDLLEDIKVSRQHGLAFRTKPDDEHRDTLVAVSIDGDPSTLEEFFASVSKNELYQIIYQVTQASIWIDRDSVLRGSYRLIVRKIRRKPKDDDPPAYDNPPAYSTLMKVVPSAP